MSAQTHTYELDQAVGQVRLLLNDVAEPWVFTDAEIQAFLDLEGSSVKRAAAQAIDTNADNEALASKVLRTQDLTVDGAKLAEALRKRATSLREQADADDEIADGGFFFGIVDLEPDCARPELTQYPYC